MAGGLVRLRSGRRVTGYRRRARPRRAVPVGGGTRRLMWQVQWRARFRVRGRGRAGHVVVVHAVQVVVRFAGRVDVGGRLGLAAATEVESIDAGAQMRAVRFGTRVGEHAHACLPGSPADAWQLSDIATKICNTPCYDLFIKIMYR